MPSITRSIRTGRNRCVVVCVGARHEYDRPFGTVSVKAWPANVRSVFIGRRFTAVFINRGPFS